MNGTNDKRLSLQQTWSMFDGRMGFRCGCAAAAAAADRGRVISLSNSVRIEHTNKMEMQFGVSSCKLCARGARVWNGIWPRK